MSTAPKKKARAEANEEKRAAKKPAAKKSLAECKELKYLDVGGWHLVQELIEFPERK